MIDGLLCCPSFDIRNQMLNKTHICIPSLFSVQGNEAEGMVKTSTLITIGIFILDASDFRRAKGDKSESA